MPFLTIGTTPITIIEADKKRKTLSITNTHATAIVYLDDKAQPASGNAKWILYPYESIFFLKAEGDFPERAFFASSDTASTILVIGFQNEEK